MKNKEIFALYQALSNINLKGVKFAHAVAKNINILKPEIIAFEASKKPREDYVAYDTERIELVKSIADKDEKGKPIINGNEFQVSDTEKFEEEFKKLQEKHSEALAYRKEQEKDFSDLMESDCKVELYKVSIENVPEEITTKQYTDLYAIISE